MADFMVIPERVSLSGVRPEAIAGQDIVGGVLVTILRRADGGQGVLTCLPAAGKAGGAVVRRMGHEFQDVGAYSPLPRP